MDKVVVGYVVSKEKHPEADKLNICQVDVGEAGCGAPNVDAGQKSLLLVQVHIYQVALKSKKNFAVMNRTE